MKRNAKRVLAHFLAVVMLLSCLSALFVGGTVTASAAASVYNANGTRALPTPVNNVYTITTANQFMAIMDALNGGHNFDGETIVLATDIVINQGNASTWGSGAPSVSWSGNADGWGSRFTGTFDGQGHYVSGLYNSNNNNAGMFGRVTGYAVFKNLTIKNSYFRSTAGTDGSGIGGLIGVVDPGWNGERAVTPTISNVHIESTTIETTQGCPGVGGIVGQVANFNSSTLTIENCSFEGTIKAPGSSHVGGIFGYVQNGIDIVLKNCSFEGTITAPGSSHVGGIFGHGQNGRDIVLKNCSANATINVGSGSQVGGLVGFMKYGRTLVLENCSADATITCANEAAGLVGRFESSYGMQISNCLAKGSITATVPCTNGNSYYRTGALIGIIDLWSGYDAAVQINNVLAAVKCNSHESLIATIRGDNNVRTVTFGLTNIVYDSTLQTPIGLVRRDNYPAPKAKVNDSSTVHSTNWHLDPHIGTAYFNTTGKASTELEGQNVFNSWTAVSGDYPKPPSNFVLEPYSGTLSYAYVTEGNTITVYTAEQMMGLAQASGTDSFSGKTIKLARDIIINQGDASTWASSAPSSNWAFSWTKGSRFLGIFDGQGHTISGVYSNKPDHVGLFKIVGQGCEIKNLNVVNSYFEGTETWGDVGGLIGYLYGEGDTETGTYTITNVSVDAIVKGKRHVGGLIGGDEGASQNKATTTNITNCAFSGTASCSDGNVGGLVGWACATKNIDGCSVKGTLTASGAYVGGLIGYINRGVATTSVSASNCNVKAEISGSEQLGGLFGRIANVQSVTISNCMAKSDITPSKTSNTTTAGLIGAYNTDSGVATASISNTLISVRGEYVTAVLVSHWGSQKLTLTLNTVKYDSNRFNGSRARDAYKSNETNFACTTKTTGVTFASIKGTAVFSSGWTAVPGNYPVPTSAKAIDSSKAAAFQKYGNKPTQLVGYQYKSNGSTYTLRLVATFRNTGNYKSAGFKDVTVTLTNGSSKYIKEWHCQRAYRSVNASDVSLKANEYLADAFFFLTITGIPSGADVASIVATPFVKTSSTAATYGDQVNWSLDQAVVVQNTSSTPLLTVMSLNMNLDPTADPDGSGSKTGDDRRAAMRQQIVDQDPDIICFQEDGWSDYPQMNNLTTGRGYSLYKGSASISHATDDNNVKRYIYQRIYYKTSKFTLDASGQRSLSDNPNTVPGKFSGYGNECRERGFSYVKLTLKSNTSKSFYVFNVHLENADSEKRYKEVFSLISQVNSIAGSTPYMLCGDFNLITHHDVDSNDVTAKAQLKAAYEDSRLIADFTETFGTYINADTEITGNKVFGTSYTTSGKGNIIDYCFLSKNKFHVYSYDVISEKQNGIYSSDHLPIVIKMWLI